MVRVLSSCYDLTREQAALALETLLRTKEIVGQDHDLGYRRGENGRHEPDRAGMRLE
jgi:predicted nucleic-acid-binding protein